MQNRSTLQNVFGIFSTRIYVLLINGLLGIIIPRFLGPEATGIFFSVLVIPALLFRLFETGIKGSATYHIGKKIFDPQQILSALIVIFIISSAASIVIISLTYYFMAEPAYTVMLVLPAIFITPLQLLAGYSKAVLFAREQIRIFNRINSATVTINLICVIIFVGLLKGSVFGALLALLVANFIMAIISVNMVFKGLSFRFSFSGTVMKSLYRMGVLFAVSFLIMQMNYRVDIILLEKLSSHTEIGYYSLGVNLAQLLWEIPASVSLVLIVKSATTPDEKIMSGKINQSIRISLPLTILTALLFYFLAPVIIPFIWSEKFLPSVKMSQVILPGIIVMSLFQIINSYFLGNGKPLYAVYVFAPALLINIVLNLLWIPHYGGIGAAMASNVSYITGTLALFIIYSIKTRNNFIRIFSYGRNDFDFIKPLINKIRGKKNV